MKHPATFMIHHKKERIDIFILSEMIRGAGWIDNTTVIVSCAPEYSNIICQILAHLLSPINDNKPLPIEYIEMPYPNSTLQEKNDCMKSIGDFFRRNQFSLNKYLFVDSGVIRGTNFTNLKEMICRTMPHKLQNDNVRFATLYQEKNSVFNCDYKVQIYDQAEQGELTFYWENPNNPHWITK